MSTEKFFTCRNDRAFKEIFMKEDNKDLLIPLLEVCLGVHIQDLTYLNLEDNVDNVHVRKKSYDLRLSTDIGRIQVEVNANIYDYSRVRQMAYLCNDYSHVTLSGDDYEEDLNMIQINFTYGLMKKFQDKYHYLYDDKGIRIYKLRDEEKKTFVDNFQIYEFNMDYFMKFWYNKDEEMIDKYRYIIMMNLDLDNLSKMTKKDMVVDKYMKEIKRVNEDPGLVHFMSYEEDLRKRQNTMLRRAKEDGVGEGFKQGIEQGIEEGKETTKRELAMKMVKEGIDFETISKITGFSNDELNKIFV